MALEERSKMHPNIIPLVRVLEFENFRREYENMQGSVDHELLGKVNELMDNYQMEGREYLMLLLRNFASFSCSISSRSFEGYKGFFCGHNLYKQ